MARTVANIIADLRAFKPDKGNWLALDSLCGELFEKRTTPKSIAELLAVFERFPEDDGAGVFWTILHGIESTKNYEPELTASVQRQPSEFGVIMLGRLLNAGATLVENVNLVELLQDVASNPKILKSVRKTAAAFAERQDSE